MRAVRQTEFHRRRAGRDRSRISSVMKQQKSSIARVLVIEPGRAERHYWRELWQYRELFRVLAWRDVTVRYKQTVIGAAWAIIRPFLTMVVFTVIFGKLANLPSEGTAPYAIMVFAGMLPWTFFSSSLADASSSIVGSANLISKVYFPRLIVPMAAVGVAFVDFAINFTMLVTMMIWYQFVPGWQISLLAAFVMFAVLASLGPGLWLTALNVNTGTSVTSFHSLFSLDYTYHQLAIVLTLYRPNGVCYIH
jgi:lipopolysaccharide transport system permease protein